MNAPMSRQVGPVDDDVFDGDNILDDPLGTYNSVDIDSYALAAVVLMAVAAIAAIAMIFAILIGVRRRADPARLGTYSIKAAIIFLTLSIVTALASHSIVLYLVKNDPSQYSDSVADLVMAGYHTNLLWELFDFVAQANIFVTLASIAVSAHSVSRGGPTSFTRLIRWGTFFMAAVVICLALATYGIRVATHESDSTIWQNIDLIRSGDRVSASASILNWIMSLAVAGLAVFAMGSGTGKGIFFMLILANFLNIIGTTWNMVYYIRWRLEYHIVPYYVPILHAVLQMWTSLAVLLICFCIFAKKAGGIWTVGRYGQAERVPKGPTTGRPSY